jgi:transposase
MASRNGAVHVATTKRVYKGKTYTTHLLRRSYRHEGKVKHQTLGNLSHLPLDLIDTIRRRLGGGGPPESDHWEIVRTLPHGHVAAVLGSLQNLGLDALLASRRSRTRDWVVAMIVARVIAPASKLATSRALQDETATTSLSTELGIGNLDEDELYAAIDWLTERQHRIETKLAKKHLAEGTLVLYDVSSSYYTGRRSGLVKFGHNRDGKKRFPQIVYGLLCNGNGCPVAVEVFEGNTADPTTFSAQINKVRRRFGIQRVVWVGDRGMITNKRINEDLRDVDGLDWITALRADAIKKLAADGVVQPSLFDERDLVEVSAPDFPGERLMVCRNPLLADERARKRNELLAATEKELEKIAAATRRTKRPLTGEAAIALRVGRVRDRFKVAKHFVLEITDKGFSYRRDQEKIDAEAALDGLYVIRTSVTSRDMGSEDVVRAYKTLSDVERAFRCIKTIDLKIRPIHHRLDERIKGHVFLCMLAYYVEWHMRRKLAPVLFDDHQKQQARRERKSIVAPAPRSAAAKRKDHSKRTDDDAPVHSFRSLLEDLGTLAKNRVRMRGTQEEFYMLTRPTTAQARALELLDVA